MLQVMKNRIELYVLGGVLDISSTRLIHVQDAFPNQAAGNDRVPSL